MKFRTEITLTPLRRPLNCRTRILALGSCFSEEIGSRLRRVGIHTTINPTGTLFNPESIARQVECFAKGDALTAGELRFDGEVWYHFDLHGSLSHPDQMMALERMNRALQCGCKALQSSEAVVVTFGTAWVYERQGVVVSNCHKQPASEFLRRSLSVGEIVGRWSALLEGPLCQKRLLFTLSPVRHLRNGAEENSLSKAILRLAIEELCRRYPEQCDYLPAGELLLDELRDYRFYATDLAHPSEEAADYIWERLREVLFDAESRRHIEEAERLVRALAHRPLHPETPSARSFQESIRKAVCDLEARSGLSIWAQSEE